MIDHVAYQTGMWVGSHVVAPFVRGVVDAAGSEIGESVRSIIMPEGIPSWLKRLL